MKQELQKLIEDKFGKIQWGGAMGWGEGLITASIIINGETIKGISHGDCTELEALIDLAKKTNILQLNINYATIIEN